MDLRKPEIIDALYKDHGQVFLDKLAIKDHAASTLMSLKLKMFEVSFFSFDRSLDELGAFSNGLF